MRSGPEPGREPEGRPSVEGTPDPFGRADGVSGRHRLEDEDAAGTPPGQPDRDRGGFQGPDSGSGDGAGGGEAGDRAGGDRGGGEVGGARILPDTAALMAERDEYLNALQLLQADFENYRKRVARQHDEQSARAASDLVRKLLPVLDTLDLAEEHLGMARGESPSEEAKALVASRGQLLELLEKEGLERVDRAGVAFDPVVHDAVAHTGDDGAGDDDVGGQDTGEHGVGEYGAVEGDAGGARPGNGQSREPVVDEIYRAGYRWRGQVLRPAMVRVKG